MLTRIRNILTLPLVKNTLKLSSSSAFMMFLPLVVTPILSRIYTPEDYGEWGVFSSLLYIVSAFILLSYENTIVKTTDENEVPSLIALCFIAMFFVIGVLIAVFVVGRGLGHKFFVDFPCFSYLIWVLAFSGVYSISTNLANRRKQYNAMVITGITNGISQAVLRILLGFYPIMAYGLIVGNVFAQILSACLLLVFLWKYLPLNKFENVTLKEIKQVSIKYKKFPLFDAPARFIEFAVGNLSIIILAIYWEKGDVGCFSMVMQFVLIPIAIIGSAMGNVYYREISENGNSLLEVSKTTIKAAKITFVLSLLPITFLTIGGDYILFLFLGNNWTSARPMALCMSIFSVPVILSEPLLPLFRALDRQEVRLKLNLANLICSLGILIIMATITNNLYISLLLYSISYAFVRFAMFSYELKMCRMSYLNISQHMVWIIGFIYILVIIRLIPYLL